MIDEASAGDPELARKRLEAVGQLPLLDVTTEAESLARAILADGVNPAQSVRDAAHIAVAVVHGIDYLLTWNCRHLANAQLLRRLSVVCAREGYDLPLICTPEELMGE